METVTAETVDRLPSPVRRSLQACGVVGRPMPTAVTVRQTGQIRTSPSSGWMRFKAAEDYTLDPPGFVWKAGLRVGGVPFGRATDSLVEGQGRMLVRILGTFTVVDESGPQMDQGSIMRWLNETMWFPAVWVSDVISWEQIDETSAAGSVTIGDVTAQAEFRFDARGQLVDFVADRFRESEDGFQMTKWSTPLTAHRRFDGVVLPAAGSAKWHLPDGAFEYISIAVKDVRYT